MSAITWRSLSGHDLPDPTRLLAMGQASLNAGMEGFQKMSDGYLQGQQNLKDKAKVTATDNFMSDLQGIKTPEEFKQREDILRASIRSQGEGIDGRSALASLDGRLTMLQQRGLATQQYTDQQTEVANRPVEAGYRGALAQAKTPEGVSGLMESMQAAVGAGAMDPRIFAKVMQEARGTNIALVGEQRAAGTYERQGQDLESNILHRANQDAIAKTKAETDRQQLGVSQQNLKEARAAREAASGNASINARSSLLKNMADLTQETTKAINEVEKSTPYAVNFSDKNSEAVRKIANDLNGTPKYGVAVLSKLTELAKIYKGGIPLEVVTSSLDMAKNNTFDFMNRSDGYADNVAEHIATQMKEPGTLEKMVYAKEVMAKARGQYNGNVPEPAAANPAKPDLPKPLATPGINDRPLPPKLQPPPPEVSKTGSLIYASPESFNISSNKGIMLPAKMPSGKMEAVVKDGDTVEVKGDNGVAMNFRFNGLDAQETSKTKDGKTTQGQKYSEEAKAFITEAFKKGKVDIKVASNKPDSYGRHVADVYVNGESLNEALLRRGLATVLKVAGGIGPSQNAAFTRIQEQAMRDNVGIMGDMGSDRSPTGAAYRMFGDTLYR